jgi:hypothetical protein
VLAVDVGIQGARTDQEGEYRIHGLEPGTHYLYVLPDRGVPLAPIEIELPPGPHRLDLELGLPVRGQVVDGIGRAIQRATVRVASRQTDGSPGPDWLGLEEWQRAARHGARDSRRAGVDVDDELQDDLERFDYARDFARASQGVTTDALGNFAVPAMQSDLPLDVEVHHQGLLTRFSLATPEETGGDLGQLRIEARGVLVVDVVTPIRPPETQWTWHLEHLGTGSHRSGRLLERPLEIPDLQPGSYRMSVRSKQGDELGFGLFRIEPGETSWETLAPWHR